MNSMINALTKRALKFNKLANFRKNKLDNEDIYAAPAPYMAPLWLLSPPKSPSVPWAWGIPSLEFPVSQLCTSNQMEGEFYKQLCASAAVQPEAHRKVWEFIYVKAVFDYYGLLNPGRRLLGFGIGQEPLPAAFAGRGASVLATDAPSETIANMGWDTTNQHASSLEQLYRWEIVSKEDFERLVSFEPLDMHAIPAHLTDFDGCWSACALEHLGSIDHGLDFIESSLRTLKPGGVAVHTTEFNLSSNAETFDRDYLAIYRRQDFERLVARLVEQGHFVAPLNLHPGTTAVDEHIDLPPYALPHLKLEVAGFVTTSFGLIVVKDGLSTDACAVVTE